MQKRLRGLYGELPGPAEQSIAEQSRSDSVSALQQEFWLLAIFLVPLRSPLFAKRTLRRASLLPLCFKSRLSSVRLSRPKPNGSHTSTYFFCGYRRLETHLQAGPVDGGRRHMSRSSFFSCRCQSQTKGFIPRRLWRPTTQVLISPAGPLAASTSWKRSEVVASSLLLGRRFFLPSESNVGGDFAFHGLDTTGSIWVIPQAKRDHTRLEKFQCRVCLSVLYKWCKKKKKN